MLMVCRHWGPFIASIATVFVFWGLTPTQSGIFATATVNRTESGLMAYSDVFVPLDQQVAGLSATSANSVSSILWLNETLQPFMAAGAMLAPFAPVSSSFGEQQEQGRWTSETVQYFANVTCEEAIIWDQGEVVRLNSTWGCSYNAPSLRTPGSVNDTDNTKVFDARYIG